MHEPAGPRAAAQNARGGSGVPSAGVPHAWFLVGHPRGPGAVSCEQRSYALSGGASNAYSLSLAMEQVSDFGRTAWVVNDSAVAVRLVGDRPHAHQPGYTPATGYELSAPEHEILTR